MHKFIKIAECVLGIVAILCFVLFIITGENQIFLIIIAVLFVLFLSLVVSYQLSSPVIRTKAKVIKRPGVAFGDVMEYITFLLPSGEKVELLDYGGENPSIKEGDSVFLEYCGTDIVEIRKLKANSPVITVKAKIVKRPRIGFFYTIGDVTFLLSDGKKLKLEIRAGRYLSIKTGDFVLLEYAGNIIISMKKIKKAFSSPQVEKMKASFNKMTKAQKSVFIKNLKERLQGSKSVEFKEFLNECITQYNLGIKGSKST